MSQVNHNAAYATVIDGFTPIERLRVTRNFIHDREHAKRISDISILKLEAEIEEIKTNMSGTPTKVEQMEYDLKIFELDQAKDLNLDCVNELNFLYKMEQALIELAAPFWDDTLSDKENYERNFAMEQAMRLCNKAECDIGAYGRLSAETLSSLRRDPFATDMLVKKGVINKEGATALLNSSMVTATNIGLITRTGDSFLPSGGYQALLNIITEFGGEEMRALLPAPVVSDLSEVNMGAVIEKLPVDEAVANAKQVTQEDFDTTTTDATPATDTTTTDATPATDTTTTDATPATDTTTTDATPATDTTTTDATVTTGTATTGSTGS